MSKLGNEKDVHGQQLEHLESPPANEKGTFEHHGQVLRDEELLNEAYRAETNEHEMGLWEAAKTHPAACFWAFIMAFTIVSPASKSI